jgi:hypothetical protein
MNYYTCGLLDATGEVLLALDDPKIYFTCNGEKVRGSQCRAELSKRLSPYVSHGAEFKNVCPWRDSVDVSR